MHQICPHCNKTIGFLPVVVVSVKETSKDCWRISFDGRVLGDSKGYSKDGAIKEAQAYVEKANKWPHRIEQYAFWQA